MAENTFQHPARARPRVQPSCAGWTRDRWTAVGTTSCPRGACVTAPPRAAGRSAGRGHCPFQVGAAAPGVWPLHRSRAGRARGVSGAPAGVSSAL